MLGSVETASEVGRRSLLGDRRRVDRASRGHRAATDRRRRRPRRHHVTLEYVDPAVDERTGADERSAADDRVGRGPGSGCRECDDRRRDQGRDHRKAHRGAWRENRRVRIHVANIEGAPMASRYRGVAGRTVKGRLAAASASGSSTRTTVLGRLASISIAPASSWTALVLATRSRGRGHAHERHNAPAHGDHQDYGGHPRPSQGTASGAPHRSTRCGREDRAYQKKAADGHSVGLEPMIATVHHGSAITVGASLLG